ncbi:MAG TPA: hypothetical protein PKH06_00495 [Candidatus Dojkabacteria bacterium]|nr:hypothetical protein [Candidatus Dojkabacteria bacterium]
MDNPDSLSELEGSESVNRPEENTVLDIAAEEEETLDIKEAEILVTENASIALDLIQRSPNQEIVSLAKETIDLGKRVKELKEHINPRLISKEHDLEGRGKIVEDAILAKTDKEILEDNKKSTTARREEKEKEITQILNKTQPLKEEKRRIIKELNKRESSIVDKLRNKINRKKLDNIEIEIVSQNKGLRNLYDEKYILRKQEEGEEENIKEIPTSSEILSAYYEKMESMPLSIKEKEDLLKPEALAQLSTEEYVKLWKRLNPYYLSHVTRQGFRDHNAMMYHSAGIGQYGNGFVEVAEDKGIIRPPIFIRENGLRSRDKESVRGWLEDNKIFKGNKEQAQSRVHELINIQKVIDTPKYPDVTAVHFMTEHVGNRYYGGERGNEVFFIFPTDVVASQNYFHFNGREKSFTNPQSEEKWNDIFVWSKTQENPGVPIDAGLVFLPNSTLVDPETGSKYASKIVISGDGTKKRVLIEDSNITERVVNYYREVTENPSNEVLQAQKSFDLERDPNMVGTKERLVRDLIEKQITSLGIPSDISWVLAGNILTIMQTSGVEATDKDLVSVVEDSKANYKRAEGAITAKEYWENYFIKHPDIAPKHIVFYDGAPTQAVNQFLRENKIGGADTSRINGALLGFDENHILDTDDARANIGKEELERTAEEIVQQYYTGIL